VLVVSCGVTFALASHYGPKRGPAAGGFAPPAGGTVPPPAPAPRDPSAFDVNNFGYWAQDPEEAKRRAGAEKKDILMLFNASDWNPWCARLANEVFYQLEFRRGAPQHFILVYLDFPRDGAARGRVQDPARNERVRAEYGVDTYPTVVLADARGKPYAYESYQQGGAAAYLDRLVQLREVRKERDRLLAQVEKADGADKLAAAREALAFLQEHELVTAYQPLVADWADLARAQDPGNAKGKVEEFFEAEWVGKARRAGGDAAKVTEAVAGLDGWKKQFRFKDVNRAARLHLAAAHLLAQTEQHDAAMRLLKEGAAYKPTDPELRRQLTNVAGVLGLSSGTGFIAAEGGYVLTNRHVVSAKGKVFVRVPNVPDPLPADVLARDERRDIALLRVAAPGGVTLKPLTLSAERPLARGESVAALGYPLGDAVGSDLKLTTGVVSSLPEPGNQNMVVLDARVNPGNSGGPLCDAYGNVVGIVTAKVGGAGLDSYGMALPAKDLESFLRKYVNDYKAAEPSAQKKAWNEVDKEVSPSVVMILQARPADDEEGAPRRRSRGE
jgi:S1-C subfamily serine protease